MPVDMQELVADLTAETRVVHDLVAPLDEGDWARPTPAEGWTIRDQVSHLAYFDGTATLAVTDSKRFREEAVALMELGPGFPDEIAQRYQDIPAADLLAWFRRARQRLVATFTDVSPKARLPWYGPDMSAASSVTARLMETWAHGQDVADALGVQREPTDRLRHIAHLGVGTFGFVFRLNGRAVPDTPVRVELTAPDRSTWAWGPEDAEDRVTGTALDFCLAVTQRRHVADTALQISGSVAREWMSIAQAFAGAPGQGRSPGQFPAETAGSARP
jgi:uncharacterized protein (TIGR03084 family)